MTKMKYSEFLQMVIDSLTQEDYFICINLQHMPQFQKYPEHKAKLIKTIKRKLLALNMKYTGENYGSNTFFRLQVEYNLPEVETRVRWLTTLKEIHEAKGN